MSRFLEDQEDVQFAEPFLAQKSVKFKIGYAEKVEWEAKTGGVKNGQKYAACKLLLELDDTTVKTEHANAKPKKNAKHMQAMQNIPLLKRLLFVVNLNVKEKNIAMLQNKSTRISFTR